ncbi:hypothetical protein KC359_g138 [Hortaea werneckii]|nr:hypothetical protein KC359_g138 [Hortaea werneckii]
MTSEHVVSFDVHSSRRRGLIGMAEQALRTRSPSCQRHHRPSHAAQQNLPRIKRPFLGRTRFPRPLLRHGRRLTRNARRSNVKRPHLQS